MVWKLIGYTDDTELRPTAQSGFSFSYIRQQVEAHLGPDAAAMLSEPQVVPGAGRRQWMVEAPVSAPAVRLDRASPDQAAAATRMLADVRARARAAYETLGAAGGETGRQQAVAILRAFEVPNDDEYVWIVGGRPVLVAWGHVKATVVPREPGELAWSYQRLLPDERPSSEPTIQQGAPEALRSTPPARARSYARALAPILWCVFVALAIAVGSFLLPACSINIPGTNLHWTWAAGCVARAHNPLQSIIAENGALEASLQALQLGLAQRAYCPPPPPPPPPPAANDKSNSEIAKRGGDVHAPVQVTLEWDTPDDLDLIVFCPDGAISPLNRDRARNGNCGDGRRDVDSNYKMLRFDDPPVEHISLHTMPQGIYTVEVYPSGTKSKDIIPFKITLRIKDSVQICSGNVRWDGTSGYATDVIDFDPSRSAPSCYIRNYPLRVCHSDEICGKQ